MCGIVGYLSHTWDANGTEILHGMAEALAHRGPDDFGAWHEETGGIRLGHRRLAIIDPSPQGHQPMVSHCGRYVIVLNGEIYNHLELRRTLGERPWRGHSDTETLLACFTRYGVERSLSIVIGMFAFAVWDREQHQLVLARDRMGEKPLYYGTLPSGDFLFASELKAIRAHPKWRGEVDREALTLFLRHNCIPAPWSIYRNIRKLRPGHWLSVKSNGHAEEGVYWDLVDVAKSSSARRAEPLSDERAVQRLEEVLGHAVRDQLISDVPLGAFLSGGVDSSTIVALMVRQSAQRVRTFSIGFSEPGYNEAEYAKAVANHLGTDHTEFYVTARDALAVVPRLPTIYDEPFADSSQVVTFLLAQMARRGVTVALSGDAGDELFAGYSRYLLAQGIRRRLGWLPLGFRAWLSRRVVATSPQAWDGLAGHAMRLLPRPWRIGAAGDKVHKFAASVLPARNSAEMYRALVSHWQDPASVVLHAAEPQTLLEDAAVQGAMSHAVERMSLTDQLTYLPDDILVKVDRAAMAVSLETRSPFLDPRVVEYAWQVPMHQKIRNGQTKWLLRQLLYRHVPHALIERPKQGFGIPLASWLRGPLREWAEALLSPARLQQEGYFSAGEIRTKWHEHLEGRRNWQYLLWDILMFQAWLDANAAALDVPAVTRVRSIA
jgi:asparagine synthase (glutamine-hydrolysing)